MSEEAFRVHRRAIDARTQETIDWFVDHDFGGIASKDPEEGSIEQAYWKAGYLRALRDVRRGKLVVAHLSNGKPFVDR